MAALLEGVFGTWNREASPSRARSSVCAQRVGEISIRVVIVRFGLHFVVNPDLVGVTEPRVLGSFSPLSPTHVAPHAPKDRTLPRIG